MDPTMIYVLAFTAGGLWFTIEGFLSACEWVKKTPTIERFNWFKAAKTVIPALGVSFLAALAAPQSLTLSWVSASQVVGVLSSGYVFAKLQRKGEKALPEEYFDWAE
jgi:hypothetical protein